MGTMRKNRSRKKSSHQSAPATGDRDLPPSSPKKNTSKVFVILLGLVVALITTAYLSDDISSLSTTQKPAPVITRGNIKFENRQSTSGVNFVLNNGTTADKPVIDSTLGGVAVFDYNNDGRLDIFFTNGAHIPSLKKISPEFYNRLYENQADGAFIDITQTAGLIGSGYSMGAAVGDYDNDGWDDLYVTGVNTNNLYRNNRNGTFTDVTLSAKVTGHFESGQKPWAVASTWFDYNQDGHLDLFVVNYLDWSFEKNKLCGDPGKRLSCSPALYGGSANILYRNEGDGTFSNVSKETTLATHIGKGMSAAIADYDGDGKIDIFVTNDSERNFLFRNIEGKKFQEVAVESAVAFTEDGIPVSSMGLDFRDLNNDGQPDITVTALANETYPLFINKSGGRFVDETYQAQIGLPSNTMSGWGNGIFDFDGDGWKDIFTANSHVSENLEFYRQQKYKLPNAIFQNLGDGTFEDVGYQAGLLTASAHRGAAFGDLDKDGRIDVVVSVIGEPAEILYNISEPNQNWIMLHVMGSRSNRAAIGTQIKLTTKSGTIQHNQVTTAVGYASSSDRLVHFGLGKETSILEIELLYPSGALQTLRDINVNQVLEIHEPE